MLSVREDHNEVISIIDELDSNVVSFTVFKDIDEDQFSLATILINDYKELGLVISHSDDSDEDLIKVLDLVKKYVDEEFDMENVYNFEFIANSKELADTLDIQYVFNADGEKYDKAREITNKLRKMN